MHQTRSATGSRSRSVLILFGLWFCTQFVGLFSPPLLDDVDGIHMEAAREMALRHDYVTLYVDGIRYLDKPPLPYWLGAFAIQIFGPHDWAVRLTLALASLILALYVYSLGKRVFGERAGFYAACASVTAIGPYIYTRFFIPDIIIALWMTIAADLILRLTTSAENKSRSTPWQVISFALVCTGALLTKGLIGLVFPFGLLLLYLLVTRRLALILRMRPLLGLLTFLLTAVPWHVFAAIQNAASGESKGFLWFYFVNDQINRYLNKRIPHDYNKVPLLLFYALLVVWIMPWGLFLLGAARQWWQTRRPLQLGGARLLFALWAILIVGFFTFSTRQEYYTLPAVPALALLIGAYLSDEETGKLKTLRWARISSVFLFVVGVLVAVVCGYLALASKTPAHGAELYEELSKNPQDYTLSFGHLLDLTTTAFGFFKAPLIGMALSMFFTTGIALWLRLKNRLYWANLSLAIGMCAVIACVHQGLATFYPILGSEPLARSIQRQWHQGDTVVIDGEYSNGSSINFYLREPVYMLNGRVNNLWYGSLYADAPHRFEDDQSFSTLWHSPQRVFFVTHDKERTLKWQQSDGGHIVASSSGKFVLLNHEQ